MASEQFLPTAVSSPDLSETRALFTWLSPEDTWTPLNASWRFVGWWELLFSLLSIDMCRSVGCLRWQISRHPFLQLLLKYPLTRHPKQNPFFSEIPASSHAAVNWSVDNWLVHDPLYDMDMRYLGYLKLLLFWYPLYTEFEWLLVILLLQSFSCYRSFLLWELLIQHC